MNNTYASLDPVPVSVPTEKHLRRNRTFQGIPGIERTASGRLFAVWYGGGTLECAENYVMLVCSDDDGVTWSEPVAVVDPANHFVRAFDSTLWISPNGRFYWFWAQSSGVSCARLWEPSYDGIAGVFYSFLENPDAPPDQFCFSPSVRIANGIMMNKPTVLQDGTWCLPTSVWTGKEWLRHPHLAVSPGCYLTVSTDWGASFHTRGRIEMSGAEVTPTFDEHMFVELADGKLECFIRVGEGVAEAFSSDQGATWSKPILSTRVRGPNSRFFIKQLRSGRRLMINHDMAQSAERSQTRDRLTAYLSDDEGQSWPYQLLLDERAEVSYPDAREGENGLIYIVYDRLRTNGGFIHMAKITEADIIAGKLVGSKSQLQMEIDHSNPVGMVNPVDGYRITGGRPTEA